MLIFEKVIEKDGNFLLYYYTKDGVQGLIASNSKKQAFLDFFRLSHIKLISYCNQFISDN